MRFATPGIIGHMGACTYNPTNDFISSTYFRLSSFVRIYAYIYIYSRTKRRDDLVCHAMVNLLGLLLFANMGKNLFRAIINPLQWDGSNYYLYVLRVCACVQIELGCDVTYHPSM